MTEGDVDADRKGGILALAAANFRVKTHSRSDRFAPSIDCFSRTLL
jgi:hypothetical protein